MGRTARGMLARIVILFISLLIGFGCARVSRIRGEIAATKAKLDEVEENGARKCAPKELAVASANLRFAELEISEGRGRRAAQHMAVAKENTALAEKKSPRDRCLGPAVVVAKCLDEDGDGICDDNDLDGDGIMDNADQCVLDPEDQDNYLDEDGCPDDDNDADRIPDATDPCRDEAEDPDGFQDEDGCPDADNDQDTVLDVDDECPNDAGVPEEKGCPKKYEGVEITDTHIKINQKIHFAYNKAVIKKNSYWILDQVVKVLADYPKIMLSIEGHTDSKGSSKYNVRLSSKRAEAVKNYLIEKGGIDRSRLTSRGFGEDRPMESNATRDGRAANRRVEFVRTDVPRQE